MSELATALAAFQADLPSVHKGDSATVPTKSGGSYSYSYAGLPDLSASVLPALAKHGLAFTAKPSLVDGAFVLAYSLLHVNGEREDGLYPLSKGTPQSIGSEITYARRYALCAVTGVAPDDDDDGQAAERQARQPAPPLLTADDKTALGTLITESGDEQLIGWFEENATKDITVATAEKIRTKLEVAP